MISVNARLFKAASLFVSNEETRYYLCGVHVEPHPDGALLVATDGHRLIAILDRKGEAARKTTIKLLPAMRRALVEYVDGVKYDDDDDDIGEVRRVRCEDRTLRVDDAGIATIDGQVSSAESCVIDARFPEWRRVPPRQPVERRQSPAFNGRYIAAFADVADLLGDGSDKTMIQIASAGFAEPALVFFPSFRDAAGVLMPMRSPLDKEADLQRPAWIDGSAPSQIAEVTEPTNAQLADDLDFIAAELCDEYAVKVRLAGRRLKGTESLLPHEPQDKPA